jgi:hypothetical protein
MIKHQENIFMNFRKLGMLFATFGFLLCLWVTPSFAQEDRQERHDRGRHHSTTSRHWNNRNNTHRRYRWQSRRYVHGHNNMWTRRHHRRHNNSGYIRRTARDQ